MGSRNISNTFRQSIDHKVGQICFVEIPYVKTKALWVLEFFAFR